MANIACPKCGSAALSSNTFQSVDFSHIAGDTILTTSNGRAKDALSNFVVWLGVRAANAIRNQHRCDHCGATF